VNAIIQLIKEVLKNGGLLSMKRTKITKEQEGKPQTILNQWFKEKSKETLTQLDSDLNNKEAGSRFQFIDKAEHEFVSLLDNKILIVVGTYSFGTAKALNSKNLVTDVKQKVLMYQETPELEAFLTTILKKLLCMLCDSTKVNQ
ncbi:33041_t:CDS:2, partial [Gigaspora margarita]